MSEEACSSPAKIFNETLFVRTDETDAHAQTGTTRQTASQSLAPTKSISGPYKAPAESLIIMPRL